MNEYILTDHLQGILKMLAISPAVRSAELGIILDAVHGLAGEKGVEENIFAWAGLPGNSSNAHSKGVPK